MRRFISILLVVIFIFHFYLSFIGLEIVGEIVVRHTMNLQEQHIAFYIEEQTGFEVAVKKIEEEDLSRLGYANTFVIIDDKSGDAYQIENNPFEIVEINKTTQSIPQSDDSTALLLQNIFLKYIKNSFLLVPGNSYQEITLDGLFIISHQNPETSIPVPPPQFV